MRLLALLLAALLVYPWGVRAQTDESRVALTKINLGDFWNYPSIEQWPRVLEKIRADEEVLDRCGASGDCPVAARRFFEAIATAEGYAGLEQLAVVNVAINASIQYSTDMEQWGQVESWSSPLETFATGRGDCEDYAIAKYVAFKRLGIPQENLAIVVLDIGEAEKHAVLYAHINGSGVMFESRANPQGLLMPILHFDHQGVRRYAPALAAAR